MAKSTKDKGKLVHIFINSPEHNSKETTQLDIERRAYEIYLMRGGSDGHALDDWVQAETELLVSDRRNPIMN